MGKIRWLPRSSDAASPKAVFKMKAGTVATVGRWSFLPNVFVKSWFVTGLGDVAL
jgi:hypothetical protein